MVSYKTADLIRDMQIELLTVRFHNKKYMKAVVHWHRIKTLAAFR